MPINTKLMSAHDCAQVTFCSLFLTKSKGGFRMRVACARLQMQYLH